MNSYLGSSAWKDVRDEDLAVAMLHETQYLFRHHDWLLGQMSNCRKDLKNAHILDYGCGIGLLDDVLLNQSGADVEGFDTSLVMRECCAQRIGKERVHDTVDSIRWGSYDIVTCNLVLCIVPDDSVVRGIMSDLRDAVRTEGDVFVSVCNPDIFRVPRTVVDIRHPTSDSYRRKHAYRKTKREGKPLGAQFGLTADSMDKPREPYTVTEIHRPTKWYERALRRTGLKHVRTTTSHHWPADDPKVEDYLFIHTTK